MTIRGSLYGADATRTTNTSRRSRSSSSRLIPRKKQRRSSITNTIALPWLALVFLVWMYLTQHLIAKTSNDSFTAANEEFILSSKIRTTTKRSSSSSSSSSYAVADGKEKASGLTQWPTSSLKSAISVDEHWWLYRPMDGNDGRHNDLVHPHQGARHPKNGTLGMVVNPSVKRLRAPKRPQETRACEKLSRGGILEGSGGLRVLQKVQLGLRKARQELLSQAQQQQSQSQQQQKSSPVKILCTVYTVYTDQDRHSNLAAIVDTWAQECDGFIAASNTTDHTLGAIDLSHAGWEEYDNMWQKVRSIWTYVYDHYANDYDYFYIGGDDTYVIVDHMRYYLQSPELSALQNGYLDEISQYHRDHGAAMTATMRPRPLIFSTVWSFRNELMILGGGGYVLNRAAVELWGRHGADHFMVEQKDPREDFFITDFYRQHGVYVTNTQDRKDGGMRFGSRTAQIYSEFNGQVGKGRRGPLHPSSIRKYGLLDPIGLDTSSEHQITFHLKEDKGRIHNLQRGIPDLIHRYHAILNSWCPAE